MNTLIDTFTVRKDELFTALVQHIQISFVSLFYSGVNCLTSWDLFN